MASPPERESRFRTHRLRVTVLLFISYVGYYFCRVTFPVALPLIEKELHFSSTQTGLILSAFYTVYAIAKLANGFLGDRIGGKVMLLVGIAGTVACNAAFGFGRELLFFVLIWATNAYFQTMGWLSIVPIMARWYRRRETGRIMGIMSLTYQLGDFTARSSAAFLIVALGWSGLFWTHAAILMLLGLALWAFLEPSPATDYLPIEPKPAVETRPARRAMLANKAFWIVCVSYLSLSIFRYVFWGWSVQYLITTGATLGTAAFTSAIFPLFGSVGSITAGWVSDRLGARRGPVLAVMSLLLTGSVTLFSRIPGTEPVWLAISLGLVGFSLYGPYSLMAGTVAMDFGGQQASATAAGIIDAVGAIGAILTGVGMGYWIDTYGWTEAFRMIIGISVVSMILNFTLWNLTPRREAGA